MTTHGPGEPSDPHVGSVAEEAAKLFGALSDLARDRGTDLGATLSGLAGQAARAARDVDEHLANGSEECTYCPICRTVHAVRQASPEVRAHLASAAASLVQAAASMMSTTVPEPHARGGVERIDLEDVNSDDPDDPDQWPEDRA